MSSSIWTLDYSEVFRGIPPMALLVTIIGIALFMINMFYTKNANREREAPARLLENSDRKSLNGLKSVNI